MKILVTGKARSIGFQVCVFSTERVDADVEIDAVNAYHGASIEDARLRSLEESAAHFVAWHREYVAQ